MPKSHHARKNDSKPWEWASGPCRSSLRLGDLQLSAASLLTTKWSVCSSWVPMNEVALDKKS